MQEKLPRRGSTTLWRQWVGAGLLGLVWVLGQPGVPAFAHGWQHDLGFQSAQHNPRYGKGGELGKDFQAALAALTQPGDAAEELLRKVATNPYAKPYLPETYRAIAKVGSVPGVDRILDRMARARDDSGCRGGAFELAAGAALGSRLKSLSSDVNGNEVDAVLKDGTIVEMKGVGPKSAPEALAKAGRQLALRCQGTCPALVMIPDNGYGSRSTFEQLARQIKTTGLTVMAVDSRTDTARVLYSNQKSSTARLLFSTPKSSTARALYSGQEGSTASIAALKRARPSPSSAHPAHQGMADHP